MTRLRRYTALSISVAAVLLAFQLAAQLDRGEEAGGLLTGPMILACFLSVPVLLASMAARLCSHRLGLALWISGAVLAAPLATWRLAPGWWGMIGPWGDNGERAPFYLDWVSISLLACLMVSPAIQAFSTRK